MKKILALTGALTALTVLTGCNASTTPQVPVDEGTNTSISAPPVTGTQDDAMETSSVAPETSDTSTPRIVTMTAENWKFSESTITAKKGEKLVLRVTAKTGTHGIGIRELGINVIVNAGETKDIEIPTDKTGTYTFFCSVPCGPGHKDMTGKIVIS